ncbi:MAG: flagellin [Opitutia bacterium Tous-C4FEB]|nr:MAG: flagellin [Opitutae bacterium Tous-C4FEB]
MPVVINTNTAASIASNNLAASNAMLQRSLNRLSSGSKIVNASDDAGGVAVASRLAAASKRSAVVSANVGNAVSFLQHQDSALKTVGKILERMSELQALYADPTKSTSDTALYGTEFSALKTSLVAMTDDKVNTLDIFATAAMSVSVNDQLSTTDAVAFGLANLGSAIGTAGSSLVIDQVSNLNTAIQTIAGQRAENGAKQSVLGFQQEMLGANRINMDAAISRIMDVDVAEESTQLARYNTLVQAGTSMVAQANQSTQSALQLLRG